jgi:osmoprotectant transport system permease protein
MDWVWSHAADIWALTLAHIGLSVPPIVLGFVVSIPLGYWASRSPAARSVLLTLGNVLYTIPGLALVVLVPVILGLSLLNPLNVVVALTVYAIAIMVRSAADAFASVSEPVKESATAQGYSAAQRFAQVEFPLAGPVLLAGLRVVSVSTISLVTVGALVGIQSLGSLFTDGFQRNFLTEAVVGFVLVLVLAAVFDLVLSLIGRLLMPWNGRQRIRPPAALSPALAVPAGPPAQEGGR